MNSFKKEQMFRNEGQFMCVSSDLQKILNTQHCDNMLLYDNRKYSIYNLTFYERGTRNGDCYL